MSPLLLKVEGLATDLGQIVSGDDVMHDLSCFSRGLQTRGWQCLIQMSRRGS